MKRLENILKKFEQAMTSAAFAEAGEFDTAQQMIQAGKNSNKKVLLSTEGGEVNPQLFRYALDLCRRLGGNLEILQVLPDSAKENHEEADLDAVGKIPASFRRKLQQMGILYRIIFARDIFEKEVAQYADKRRDLLCVVLGVSPDRAAGRHSSALRKQQLSIFKRLSCPVVFYGDPVQA
jgi:hypothetical protein